MITARQPEEIYQAHGEIEVGTHGLFIEKGFFPGLLPPQVATE